MTFSCTATTRARRRSQCCTPCANSLPGAKVVRTGAVDAHHDLARFEWHVVQPDGKVLRRGIDIAQLSTDGKIRRMMGFFL